jgi:hypothetical protein
MIYPWQVQADFLRLAQQHTSQSQPSNHDQRQQAAAQPVAGWRLYLMFGR